MKKIYLIITIILVMFTLSVCGCSSTATTKTLVVTTVVTVTVQPPTLESVGIQGDNTYIMHARDINLVHLAVFGVYSDGSKSYIDPVWTSSNPAVASVTQYPMVIDPSGVDSGYSCYVTAISVGTADIAPNIPGINITPLVSITVIP
jgi:hypothetical protein